MAQEDQPVGAPHRQRALLISGAIVAGAAAFYAGMLVGSSGDIPANTTVLGVQIGGMSQPEAVSVLTREISPLAEEPLVYQAFGSAVDVTPVEAGLSFDPVATVEAASGRLYNPLGMIQRLFGSVEVDPVVVVDESALTTSIEDFTTTIAADPVEPTMHYEDLEPVLTLGTPGRTIDVPAAMEEVADSYLVGPATIALPEVILEPSVNDDEARATQEGLGTIAVSAPVNVEVEDVTAVVEEWAIAEATHYLVEDGELRPQIDGGILHDAVARQLRPVESPGKDATFTINSSNVPVVVPSEVGRGVSDEDLAAAVGAVLGETGDARVTTAVVTVRDPKLTTEDAERLGVIEEISSFTQEVPSVDYMQHNLALAAEYINGTLLLPGEVFSMNDLTENRDPENGYMEGYVIGPGGIFELALGGGLSAATTTVWSAAFFAGLEPVEVRAHSVYISRYVPGLEATVAWDGFDMRFRNDTEYGVFISAYTTPTTMTVAMYSTKRYSLIDAEVGNRYATTKPKTIYNTSDECSPQTGGEGFTIDVDRVFYQGDEEVERETFTTTYVPSPRVVCGPKPRPEPEPEPEPEPTESPSPEPTETEQAQGDEASTAIAAAVRGWTLVSPAGRRL